jgi:hypothetical protein
MRSRLPTVLLLKLGIIHRWVRSGKFVTLVDGNDGQLAVLRVRKTGASEVTEREEGSAGVARDIDPASGIAEIVLQGAIVWREDFADGAGAS